MPEFTPKMERLAALAVPLLVWLGLWVLLSVCFMLPIPIISDWVALLGVRPWSFAMAGVAFLFALVLYAMDSRRHIQR
ncbi:MAG: hypothetical protein U0625_06735 [Phycisphaerales bacterium]